MKKVVKSVMIPVIMAVLFGYVSGKFVFRTYKDDLYDNLTSSRLYLIENGEYNDIYEMREYNSRNNYVYYKDDDKYKSVVGITRKYDNIDKIKSLYNNNVLVNEYYISNDKIDDRQDEYDMELSNANDVTEVREVVDNILELYKNSDDLKLIQID